MPERANGEGTHRKPDHLDVQFQPESHSRQMSSGPRNLDTVLRDLLSSSEIASFASRLPAKPALTGSLFYL
jgi:hypothetical protein